MDNGGYSSESGGIKPLKQRETGPKIAAFSTDRCNPIASSEDLAWSSTPLYSVYGTTTGADTLD